MRERKTLLTKQFAFMVIEKDFPQSKTFVWIWAVWNKKALGRTNNVVPELITWPSSIKAYSIYLARWSWSVSKSFERSNARHFLADSALTETEAENDFKILAWLFRRWHTTAQDVGQRIDEQIAQHGHQQAQYARCQQRVHHGGIGFGLMLPG